MHACMHYHFCASYAFFIIYFYVTFLSFAASSSFSSIDLVAIGIIQPQAAPAMQTIIDWRLGQLEKLTNPWLTFGIYFSPQLLNNSSSSSSTNPPPNTNLNPNNPKAQEINATSSPTSESAETQQQQQAQPRELSISTTSAEFAQCVENINVLNLRLANSADQCKVLRAELERAKQVRTSIDWYQSKQKRKSSVLYYSSQQMLHRPQDTIDLHLTSFRLFYFPKESKQNKLSLYIN